VWSAFTAGTAMAWSFVSLFWIRIGVGIGEAGCAPASSSIIGDLFPSSKRSRAMGLFMLGLPLGLVAAFFGGAALIRIFHTWRTPFYVAAVPGFILAVAILFIREPPRGHADGVSLVTTVEKPIRKILRIRTMWWIIVSGITVNFAVYAGNGFLVSLLVRYFRLPIVEAANMAGYIAGVTGLFGLTLGGLVADWFHRKSPQARLVYGATSLLIATPATFLALAQPRESLWPFAFLFGLGWLLYYAYYNTTYPALQDVVEPRLRATAIAIYFAGMYVLGGSAGSTVVGDLSDRFAIRAMKEAGMTTLTPEFRAVGLHDAFYLIPVMFFITAVAMFLASRSFKKDAEKMLQEIARQGGES
jgi:MFS family permease